LACMPGRCPVARAGAVGFKALAYTVESSASVDADPFRLQIRLPGRFRDTGANISTDTRAFAVSGRMLTRYVRSRLSICRSTPMTHPHDA
jgi:hypothetical protein